MSRRVDLTDCDREPIHIPGSIQPHGCLIAVDAQARTILRHSANAPAMLGVPGEMNGAYLGDALGEEAAHSVRNALARTREGGRPALLFGVTVGGRSFDVAAHRMKGTAIVEFEPSGGDTAEPLELARAMIERVGATRTVDRLVRETARLIRAMLNYDRVMVYQFTHDGAGKVVSEARRPGLESFLGQYFPAADIPRQARALYLRNTIRIISDASFEPVPILPDLDASGEPLDLSLAHLRSVSPVHCEYLRNMGVAASMSISIRIDGALWGLVACHHYAPRVLGMAERVSAELFGDFLSMQLNALRHRQALESGREARARLDRVLAKASGFDEVAEVLRGQLDDLAGLIRCDGAGIWIGGRWKAVGAAPPEREVPALVAFAATVVDGGIWATHALSQALPGAARALDRTAGMLVIPLSSRPGDYLFFFRDEVARTLDWAGNPEKVYESGPLGDRLTPRKSFAIWKETVRGQSEPWSEEERHFAEAVRIALTEILLRQSELLADEREKAAVRQRVLNDELNHRVKNILAAVKSIVASEQDGGAELRGYVEALRARIQALAFAHDQVIRGDGGGEPAELFAAELSPYRAAATVVEIGGPPVWLEARAYSVLALVIHELTTNAAKYGALSRPGGRLDVSWELNDDGSCAFHWRESGGPVVVPPARQGFGTTLIDRSIPYDLGGESEVDYHPQGIVGRFCVPSRFVGAPRRGRRAKPERSGSGAGDLTGKVALIVEDQLLIAMDLEAILEEAGMEVMGFARSTAEAFRMLEARSPDVAVLDVNLGGETSLAVAELLRARGVPFAFATGYSDLATIPGGEEGGEVVPKPYQPAQILAVLRRLLAPSA
ncbi:HWE histidine kinase domain-containing protein [Amaricoccus solimangrovi]|uniref:histidine kinase n=1 Tax=Amaricoccus solimangrovi TaxID=2589815 RepID=A0A501WPI6_9RHOB|nr:HWE histidine kinase domain-containing protein [Amaricoccus solimangrovi]TPE48941.1 GAF domain-containing protein [Amaricoccus solimangrovi]